MPLGDAGLAHLGKLQNLQYLDVSQSEVTDAGVMQLAGLKKLRVLLVPDRVTVATRKRLQETLPGLKFEGQPGDIETLPK